MKREREREINLNPISKPNLFFLSIPSVRRRQDLKDVKTQSAKGVDVESDSLGGRKQRE